MSDHQEGNDAWFQWDVQEEEAGERIDRLIYSKLDGAYSRSQIQQWIAAGSVCINKGEFVKSNYKTSTSDQIELRIPDKYRDDERMIPEAIDLDIVHEDNDVIVVNKRRGMVVHPSEGHERGTLVHALLHHCQRLSTCNGLRRQGIVHRIDKDTTGLIMVAKNDNAHERLAAQLKEHSVLRKYMAVVHGTVAHKQGTVDAPIGRHRYDRKMFTVTNESSKHAITHFVVVQQFAEHALMELQLETGRTHQIRVHMKFIEHPIVGDPVYGHNRGRNRGLDAMIRGQALHAKTLGFTHPTSGEQLLFEAPLPADMDALLTQLRQV